MDKPMKLPKPYLSYSQMRVWLDDKEAYRDRYYRGIEAPGSRYMLFGSEIAKGLEDGTIKIPALPQYQVKEYQCKVAVEGVPFYAYVDTYDPARHKLREYKTGTTRPDGGARWTDALVKNHMQLDIYSLLVEVKDGWVDEELHLDWIKTRPKVKTMVDAFGNVLQSQSSDLELTGEVESFARVITQVERDRMRILIRTVASEIAEDYRRYLDLSPPKSPDAR